jgi:pimeloyl-ACP methyl ester carboxylesterase
MPTIRVNGAALEYAESGPGGGPKAVSGGAPSGDGPPEAVVFVHGLLFDRRIFEHQVAALSGRYRCIAYDLRGHGGSETTAGGYDMDSLADDAAELIERLDAGPCHFVGLSMGGFIGLRLASRRPELIRSLTLLDTSADPEPRTNLPRYRMLNLFARLFGLGFVSGRVMPIMFGRDSMERRPELIALWKERVVAQDRRGVTRAVLGVVERDGVADELGRIGCPTLVLVGEQDTATVPEKSEKLRDGIASATMETIPSAGHMSSIENPEAVTRALLGFLDGLPTTG